MLEDNLLQFINAIREDGSQRGAWSLPRLFVDDPTGEPPLPISLARFQSYRGRTEAALIQELTDFVEDGKLRVINYETLDSGIVLLW